MPAAKEAIQQNSKLIDTFFKSRMTGMLATHMGCALVQERKLGFILSRFHCVPISHYRTEILIILSVSVNASIRHSRKYIL